MVWPLSLLCPVSPGAPQVPSSAGISEGQGVGFCSGFVQREMGLGADCGGAALPAATGLAGEDQDRNEQETLIFYCCFVFGMDGACSFL